MDPSQWIARFRALHERVKAGQASDEERLRHRAMREELAQSLLASQGQAAPPGSPARKHFRVPQVYPVEIANQYRVVTKDVSRSGFSVSINAGLEVGAEVSFSLTLARGTEPITGRVRVAMVTKAAGAARMGFAIESLSEADAERLEMALFDAVLARIK